ncbi:ankyrin repeat-containing domain protein [Stachybotrys elegans]|uniref:Ankyrin repeat-containing domain protein n=1 Tax=Stachybotrys elegans TaxID=80388 RepID=A0A8K0WP12_9HYPO|nr:ankyrin repeat-containing domain protein [Stachybotrys elegans]
MADPFSILAGAAGLLDVTVRTSSGLLAVASEMKRAPALVLELNNETAALGSVLDRVAHTRQEVSRLNTQQQTGFLTTLDQQIGNARTILNMLEAVTKELQQSKPTVKRVKWILRRRNATELKGKLREARQSINEVLVAFNVCITTAVRMELHQVQTDLRQTHQDATRNFEQKAQSTDSQLAVLQSNVTQQQQDLRAMQDLVTTQGSGIRSSMAQTNSQISILQSTLDTNSQAFAGMLVGNSQQLSDMQSALAAIAADAASCDVQHCHRTRFYRAQATYAFPLCTFKFSLVVRRRVPWERGTILHEVFYGTVQNLKRTIENNRSCIQDVYFLDGRNALHIVFDSEDKLSSLVDKVKVLVANGIDPDQENDYGQSPRERLCRNVLTKGYPPDVCAQLQEMLPISASIDTCELTILHKAVLGICPIAIEPYLKTHISFIDAPYRFGYTALRYAAMIGDAAAVKALIGTGANPYAGQGKAASFNNPDVIPYLCSAGADLKAVNKWGDTAIGMAANVNAHQALSVLLQQAAIAQCTETLGPELLHDIAENGDIETMEILKNSWTIRHLGSHSKNKAGESVTQVFERRQNITVELRLAFYSLIRGINGIGDADTGTSLADDDDIFEDAVEYL